MYELSAVAGKIDKMVQEIGEYLKQKDMTALKSRPAFVSEIAVSMVIFIDNSVSLDFLKDIEAIVSKYDLEIESYSIYPQGELYAVYIYIALF